MMRFACEHFIFGAARAFAFLAADAFDFGAFGGNEAVLPFLNFVEEQTAGEETVESLLAGFLAFDLEAGGAMKEHDAGGGFVDVLAAVAAGADEGFLDVGLADAERGHALRELRFFFRADGELGHTRIVTSVALFAISFWAKSKHKQRMTRTMARRSCGPELSSFDFWAGGFLNFGRDAV